MKKNETYTVDVIDLTYEGMGVAKIDHYPIFIANALPRETVNIQILKANKKYAFAKVIQFISKSPQRQESPHIEWTQTGIAPLQHMTYRAQLEFKRKQVQESLHKQHLDHIHVHDVEAATHELHYRNKAQVPVRMIDGVLTTGFYRKGSHSFIPMTHFGIQRQDIDDALQVICHILNEFKVTAYNEERHEGVLRHIMIRQGYYSHEMMVVLITRKNRLFQGEMIAKRIIEEIPTVVSVMQNVNDKKTNVIFGTTTRCLAGKTTIEDTMLDHHFDISALSFYQVNTPQAEKMYQKAIDLADLQPTDIAIDAYCGIGTITLSVAPYVKEIYGVEVIEDAIKDARHNAKLNHIHNAYFESGAAEKIIQRWKHEGLRPDVVFVDPPRKGLDQQFVDSVIELRPKKIAYISCNPATFARDVRLFTDACYQCQEVYPYDLFPQTTHVECVSVLTLDE